jgi:hypothetical protein
MIKVLYSLATWQPVHNRTKCNVCAQDWLLIALIQLWHSGKTLDWDFLRTLAMACAFR